MKANMKFLSQNTRENPSNHTTVTSNVCQPTGLKDERKVGGGEPSPPLQEEAPTHTESRERGRALPLCPLKRALLTAHSKHLQLSLSPANEHLTNITWDHTAILLSNY